MVRQNGRMQSGKSPMGTCRGMSLLELLVVLGVMAILAGVGLPGLRSVQDWLARTESRALFGEIQTACRIVRLQQDEWPLVFQEGEIALNEDGAGVRKWLIPFMESRIEGILVEDGYGNTDIRLIVDIDDDHWIKAEDFQGLEPANRPPAIWARAVVYSLDGAGRLAASSW